MDQKNLTHKRPKVSLERGVSPRVSASLLSANAAVFGEDLQALEQAGADWIHFDVMDGVFVPQITWGAKIIKDLRPLTKLPFDVHLMVVNPQVLSYIAAGADLITVHPASTKDLLPLIRTIKNEGCKAGLAISPGEDYQQWPQEWWASVDMVTVMTVRPGAAGQAFLKNSLETLAILRSRYPHLCVSVDGGITDVTAEYVSAADVMVSGSFLFSGYRPQGQEMPSVEGLRHRIASLKQATLSLPDALPS
jgi:ribulose-phosphate 3-epimerase